MRNLLLRLRKSLPARGLGAHLALAFCLLSVLLTLVLVEVVERVATQQVKTNIGYGLSELALQTSDKLDRGMFERHREVGLMVRRKDLFGPNVDRAEQRAALDALQETYQYYAWIGITDIDGKVLVANSGLLEGANVSKRPWFINALRGIYLGDVHEAVLLAKLLPNPSNEPKRFVDVAFPYHDTQGNVRGVLGVHLSWQWAREVERSILEPIRARRQVESLIVSSEGTVLLGPPDLQGKTLEQTSLQLARDRKNGYVIETWPDGAQYLVGYSLSQGYDNYPGLGWTVLVRQNLQDAYQPVKRIRQQALFSGIALALLFSLAGVVAARRITRPLENLAQSAQEVQHGKATAIAPAADSYLEVQSLSGAINALVSNLLERRQELRDLNLHLEQRVEQRTRELEQALIAVQASERRIHTIIEVAQDAFIGVDLRGNITDWNSQAERMFGWSRDEVIGRPVVDLIVPQRFRQSFEDAARAFGETGSTELFERRLERMVVNRDGVEFTVELTAGLVSTAETAFFSVFLHDISGRKKIEQMKNEFVSTVSHELRTPLTAIRASLSLLVDGFAGELPADVQELIQISHQSCERLVRLVNDVLDIEKIESGNMEFIRLAQPLLPLARQAVDSMQAYAQQFGITLQCHVDADSEDIEAEVDHDRITQVLTNLLSNAVKFSPPHSTVELHLVREQEHARLSVVDHGGGMPREFQERVFQRFAQADASDSGRRGGTGLGLSICKAIVEQHDGSISFDSTPGGGTVFHVRLPLV